LEYSDTLRVVLARRRRCEHPVSREKGGPIPEGPPIVGDSGTRAGCPPQSDEDCTCQIIILKSVLLANGFRFCRVTSCKTKRDLRKRTGFDPFVF
jgi:hypothetical protein